VTGGSEGIGFAIGERFAMAQRDVVLVARNADRLAEAERTMRRATGVKVSTIAMDITEAGAPAHLEAALRGQGAYADVLVNNAAVGLSHDFTSQDPARLAELVDLNVRALTLLCRQFLPAMRRRRRGGIINLASLGGLVPGPYQAAYYASKAYVISLSEALAAEVASDGVRVTVVAPGPVATAFHARMGSEADYYLRLLPVLSPANVAWWAHMGFGLSARLVVPGIVGVLAPFMKVVPHRILIPFVAWLLRPRQQETGNAGGERGG
jgi:short-subunit dehydrogenase